MLRFATISLLATALVFAEEAAPAEKPVTGGEGGIAGAKRELDAIKAARGASTVQPGLDLPRLTTPELQLGGSQPAAIRPLREKADAKKKAEKAANWLVDGVMKQTEKKADNKSEFEGQLAADGGESLLDAQKLDEPRSRTDKAADNAKDSKPSDPGLNPLTRYMAGWMTPQDYTLLRSNLAGGLAGDATSRSDSSPAAVAAGSGAGIGAANTDFSSAIATAGLTPAAFAAPRENPFLQSVVLPPTQAVVATAPANTLTPPLREPSGTTPASMPATVRSNVPDFVKPADDAKYFKQLKRF